MNVLQPIPPAFPVTAHLGRRQELGSASWKPFQWPKAWSDCWHFLGGLCLTHQYVIFLFGFSTIGLTFSFCEISKVTWVSTYDKARETWRPFLTEFYRRLYQKRTEHVSSTFSWGLIYVHIKCDNVTTQIIHFQKEKLQAVAGCAVMARRRSRYMPQDIRASVLVRPLMKQCPKE